MGRVLEIMWTTIESAWRAVRDGFAAFAADPGVLFDPIVGSLIALLLLLLLLLLLADRRRAERDEGRPELLVSRGEVRYLEESSITELIMHISNLGDGVVQLLEVALSSELMPQPETVELTVLVPRSRSVDVTAEIEELQGDTGILELYFYTPQARNRAYRLRASLTWEPWNGRYKVEPLGQRIEPARRLASSRLQQRQLEEWRRRQRSAVAEPGEPLEPAETEPQLDAGDERARARERLDFPSDF